MSMPGDTIGELKTSRHFLAFRVLSRHNSDVVRVRAEVESLQRSGLRNSLIVEHALRARPSAPLSATQWTAPLGDPKCGPNSVATARPGPHKSKPGRMSRKRPSESMQVRAKDQGFH